jgi:hypothetical protein
MHVHSFIYVGLHIISDPPHTTLCGVTRFSLVTRNLCQIGGPLIRVYHKQIVCALVLCTVRKYTLIVITCPRRKPA